jgi:hypothetical protein
MKKLAALVLVITPHVAAAEVQPHRAEYLLRLGVAANAPRIGSAIQDITSDCSKWRIKRDIKVQVPVTSSWKISATSILEGEEQRNGEAFGYRVVQIQDEAQHETRGKAQRRNGEFGVEVSSTRGPETANLPSSTLLPIAALNRLIERLRAGATSSSMLVFSGETNDAYRVDVERLKGNALRAAPYIEDAPRLSKSSWPVRMTFGQAGERGRKPLFSMSASLFETGILDRLTVDTGGFTIAADLKSLTMRDPAICPDR